MIVPLGGASSVTPPIVRLRLGPHTLGRCRYLALHPLDQLPIGGNQHLLCPELRDDGLLRGERWEGDLE